MPGRGRATGKRRRPHRDAGHGRAIQPTMRSVWPVLERELRVASRRPATWRLRLATGIVGAMATAGCFWFYGGLGGAGMEAGSALFTTLGIACGVWGMIAGCQRTADGIGRERREGTLGLLFLTDLTGWDVVLGKLAAAGCEIAYQMLALVPMMAIPLLVGGVGPVALAMLMLALANGLVMALSFGLLGSLWSRDPRQAVGLAASFLLATTVFPWGVLGYLSSREGARPVAEYLAVVLPSPVVPFLVVVRSQTFLPLQAMFVAVALQSTFSFLVLAYTARQVRSVWRQGGKRGWRARWRDFADRIRFGNPAVRAARRPRLLAEGAWVWLSRRERLKPVLPWILVVSLVAIEVWIARTIGANWAMGELSSLVPMVFHWIIRMWVAAECVVTLAEQRASGALELLLTTPLVPAEILRQQRRSVVGLLAGPWGLLLANDLGFVGWIIGTARSDDLRFALWMHLCAIATSPVHAWAMRWVATWHVVKGRASNFAVGRAMNGVLFLPGILGAVMAQMAAMVAARFEVQHVGRAALGAVVWLAVQGAWSIGWGLRHRRLVLGEFREQVTAGGGVTVSAAGH